MLNQRWRGGSDVLRFTKHMVKGGYRTKNMDVEIVMEGSNRTRAT